MKATKKIEKLFNNPLKFKYYSSVWFGHFEVFTRHTGAHAPTANIHTLLRNCSRFNFMSYLRK